MLHYIETVLETKVVFGTVDPFDARPRLNLTVPVMGLMKCVAPVDGEITTLFIKSVVDVAGAVNPVFNLRQNGTQLFSGGSRPTIVVGDSGVEETGLSIDITRGDELTLDLEIAPTVSFQFGLSMILTIEDGIAAPGIPAGGDTGQILAKASDDDNDTEWIDAPTGSGGGLDYTVDKMEDFSGMTVGPAFSVVGTGFSIAGGKGEFLPTANDGNAGSPPKVVLASPQSFVNKCLIMEIDEKPIVGGVGNYSLAMHVDDGGIGCYYYFDIATGLINGGVGSSLHSITVNPLDTFPKHHFFMRIRIASQGSGSNTHIIYFEYSFNGIVWLLYGTTPLWKETGKNFDNVNMDVTAASYSGGSTPTKSVIRKIIVGTMN